MDPILGAMIISGLLLIWLIPSDVWSFFFYLLAVGVVGTIFYWSFIFWLTTWS